jgi:hypothetical protein
MTNTRLCFFDSVIRDLLTHACLSLTNCGRTGNDADLDLKIHNYVYELN